MARTIVITGAGAGLGRALARRFAGEGETVILLGRTLAKVEALAAELGEPALAAECDVASPDSVRAAFAAIAERHPTIDVLINNAAIYEPFTVAEARDEQILGILNTNLAGPIFCARAAIAMMKPGACIINVGSESVDLPFAMLSLYQASKAGLNRLTEALSVELEDAGIRVTMVPRRIDDWTRARTHRAGTRTLRCASTRAAPRPGWTCAPGRSRRSTPSPTFSRAVIDLPP